MCIRESVKNMIIWPRICIQHTQTDSDFLWLCIIVYMYIYIVKAVNQLGKPKVHMKLFIFLESRVTLYNKFKRKTPYLLYVFQEIKQIN